MSAVSKSDLYRKLPSVDELVRQSASLTTQHGHAATLDACRSVLARLREEITTVALDDATLNRALAELASAVEIEINRSLKYSLQPVINATGVILHTNLGRTPLSPAALDHIRDVSQGYSNLELDLATGERGKRDVHVESLFAKIIASCIGTAPGCPGEQSSQSITTIIVNNNAAAVMLALNTLAEGGEVVVSRGELVEIGGLFRVPEIMAKSQAILREVGATNRTMLADYESAINPKTKLLLKVHRSNFEMSGFTHQPKLEDLVALARRRNLPLMEDLGSGSLFDLHTVGIRSEPTVLDSLRAGVDLVTYSGDKLLGGPQAGIISGSPSLIAQMRSNSLFRALRADKLTYAAMEATLLAYVREEYDSLPVLRMMRLPKSEIGLRAEKIASKFHSPKLKVDLIDGDSVVGGGSAPSALLPSRLLAVESPSLSADEIARHLRKSNPPILAHVNKDQVLLDLRTVFPEQDVHIVAALSQL